MAAPSRHRASHVFNVIVIVVGGIALARMIYSLDGASTRALVGRIGGWFVLVLAIDLVGTGCSAAAIHAFMRPEARMVSYLQVFAAQASGRAVNLVTPGGALGEATKVTMLAIHAPHARAVSSIVLFDLAGFYLSVASVVIGVPLTTLLVDLPSGIEHTVWIATGVAAAVLAGLAILIHHGALATGLAAAVRLRFVSPARRDAWRDKLAEIDRHIRELLHDRTPGTRIGMAWVGAAQLCSWATTIAILAAVGVPLSAGFVIGVLSVGVVIGWVGSIVPLGIGIVDGSTAALFAVFGVPPSLGIIVTLVNRARSLAAALFGLAIMAIGHTANRVSLARQHARLLAATGSGAPGDDRERLVVGPDRE